MSKAGMASADATEGAGSCRATSAPAAAAANPCTTSPGSDEEAELEAYLDDRCKWTIFEDAEDEVRYLRRRCDVLSRGVLAARAEARELHRAGYSLQEAYDVLRLELQEAIGDVAYWQELAEARAEELTAARASAQAKSSAPPAEAPEGRNAKKSRPHAAEEQQSLGAEERRCDQFQVVALEAVASTPPAATAPSAAAASGNDSSASVVAAPLSPPPSWRRRGACGTGNASPAAPATPEWSARRETPQDAAAAAAASREVPPLPEFSPAEVQASRAEADRWKMLAELRAQENDILRQATALHNLRSSPSPSRSRSPGGRGLSSPSSRSCGGSHVPVSLFRQQEAIAGNGLPAATGTASAGAMQQVVPSRSVSPSSRRQSPSCSRHTASPLPQVRTPPRRRSTTPPPASWRQGLATMSGAGHSAAAAPQPSESPRPEFGHASAMSARRSLFSPADAASGSQSQQQPFGPGSVPRRCPGLGGPTRRAGAAGGKENARIQDNLPAREEVKSCSGGRFAWAADGILSASSPGRGSTARGGGAAAAQPQSRLGAGVHSSRGAGQGRQQLAAQASSSRQQSSFGRGVGPTSSPIHQPAAALAAAAPLGPRAAIAPGGGGEAKALQAAVSQRVPVSGGPTLAGATATRHYHGAATPPRPSSRASAASGAPQSLGKHRLQTESLGTPSFPQLAADGYPEPPVPEASPAPPKEPETTPAKARRLAHVLDLPGGIAALTNSDDLPEGKTLEVWLRYALR